MDQSTIEQWAAIGGFAADVQELFQRATHQDETIGILQRTNAAQTESLRSQDQIIAQCERMITTQAETIASHAKTIAILLGDAPASAVPALDAQNPHLEALTVRPAGRSIATAQQFHGARAGNPMPAGARVHVDRHREEGTPEC
jgi:hypothetical protein